MILLLLLLLLHVLLSYFFEKKSLMSVVWTYVSYIFMALWLRMFVAGANKVEGTMSWCLGTNQILASIKEMVLPKVKQGHFETTMLILHNFSSFIEGTGVWKHYIKYLHDSNAVYSDAAV